MKHIKNLWILLVVVGYVSSIFASLEDDSKKSESDIKHEEFKREEEQEEQERRKEQIQEQEEYQRYIQREARMIRAEGSQNKDQMNQSQRLRDTAASIVPHLTRGIETTKISQLDRIDNTTYETERKSADDELNTALGPFHSEEITQSEAALSRSKDIRDTLQRSYQDALIKLHYESQLGDIKLADKQAFDVINKQVESKLQEIYDQLYKSPTEVDVARQQEAFEKILTLARDTKLQMQEILQKQSDRQKISQEQRQQLKNHIERATTLREKREAISRLDRFEIQDQVTLERMEKDKKASFEKLRRVLARSLAKTLLLIFGIRFKLGQPQKQAKKGPVVARQNK